MTDAMIKDFGYHPVRQISWGYNPATEEAVELPPAFINNEWVQQWETHPLAADKIAANLTAAKNALILKIDADADAIYHAVMGNRATEYSQANADATAYKTAGYTGTVPAYVQAWATATGKTAQWAADDILATAAAWLQAQAAIRQNRLARKEAARTATDSGALIVVKSQWESFVAAIKGQLKI
jgi:hypothetical protein